MVNIRADRLAYAAGDEIRFEFWVCNDTHDAPAGAHLRYQLEIGGKVVFANRTKARIEPCRSTFQGFLRRSAPLVKTRTAAVLRLALTSPDGKVIHDTAAMVDLFPPPSAVLRDARVAVVGSRNGKAARLVREDASVMISGGMYDTFCKPYAQRLLEQFGGCIHWCGDGKAWWRSLITLRNLNAVNPCQGQFYDPVEMHHACRDAGVMVCQWTTGLTPAQREQIRTGFTLVQWAADVDAAKVVYCQWGRGA